MRLEIRTRVALLCTLSIMAVVVAVTALQAWQTHHSAREAVGAPLSALAAARAAAIDREFELRRRALAQAAAITPHDALADTASAERYLGVRPVLASLFSSLFLVSADGRVVADSKRRPGRAGIDVSDRQYLRDVREKRQVVISEPIIGRPSGQPQLVFAAPVLDAGGAYLGALLGSVDLLSAEVTGGLSTERIGRTGYFFLVAQKPYVTMVSHPDKTRIMKPLDPPNMLTARALAGWEGTEEGHSRSGERVFYSYKRLQATGWIVGARIPYDEAFAPIESALARVAAIGLAAALLCGLLTWLFVTRMLRPLADLRTEIGRGIRESGYAPRPPSARNDELGDLSREFAELVRQRTALNEALAEANAGLDARIERKTADLKHQADEMELFLYTLGHDLRSPVRAISAYSEIVLRSHGDRLDEGAKRMIERCAENGVQMGRLIDGMLELGRVSRLSISGTELAGVDVRKLFDEALRGLPVPDGMEVRIGDLPPALAEVRLLRGVVRALLQNAIKFSARAEAPLVEVGFEARDDEVEYFVRDNGVGFDMRYVEALFKPFSRLHVGEDYPGSGIDLAIAKRSVEIMGGRISAEGTAPGGACFRFVLKRAAPA